MADIGGTIGRFLGVDLTPGFNVGWNFGNANSPIYPTIVGTGVNPRAPKTNKTASSGSAPRPSTSNNTGANNTANNDVWYGNTLGANTGGYSGGYSAPAAPAGPSYDQAVVDQFDSGISALEAAMGRLPKQLDIAKANVGDQYSTNLNRFKSAFDAAQNNYKTSGTQNMQSLRSNKNNITDQASQGLRGLMRTLGMYGAVGSDMNLAGNAVADTATAQRSGAGEVFSQNQRSLDKNWGNFQNEDKNRRKELNDWRTQQIRSAEQQSASTKQDLLSRLAELRGQRAATMGGSFKGAAQPYLDKANALSSRIDSLGRFKPTFDGHTPVYKAPTLDSYEIGEGPQINTGQGQQMAGTPALNTLLGLNPREDEDRVTF